jgi:hypothetical protein
VARSLAENALVVAVTHLVGQSRAFLYELEAASGEIGIQPDARVDRLAATLGLTLREPAAPGTLRQVEQVATELLRMLTRCEAL